MSGSSPKGDTSPGCLCPQPRLPFQPPGAIRNATAGLVSIPHIPVHPWPVPRAGAGAVSLLPAGLYLQGAALSAQAYLKIFKQNTVKHISKVSYEWWEQNCGLNAQRVRWNSAMPVMLEDGLAACSSPFLAWKFEFWGGLDSLLCLCIFNVVLVCLFKQMYQIWCGKLTFSFSCPTASLKFFSPVKLSA